LEEEGSTFDSYSPQRGKSILEKGSIYTTQESSSVLTGGFSGLRKGSFLQLGGAKKEERIAYSSLVGHSAHDGLKGTPWPQKEKGLS